jgi:hypothetical protein
MGSECLGAWGSTSFTALAVDISGAIVASADVDLSGGTPTIWHHNPQVRAGRRLRLVEHADLTKPRRLAKTSSALALDGSGNVVVAGTA